MTEHEAPSGRASTVAEAARKDPIASLRRWWREDRSVYLHRQWRGFGWRGDGWNCLTLGFVTVWF